MKKNVKQLCIMTVAAVFLFSNMQSWAEEIESRKLSVIQTQGTEAYITKENQQRMTAFAGMNLGQGNQAFTGNVSSMYIEADQDKILKLAENTLTEITKASAKSLKLTLKNGNLFFNVENPLKADEELKFEAAQTSMSIRGTSGIFQMNAESLIFYLLEGSVVWDLGDDQILEIDRGQMVELIRDWRNESLGPGAEKKYILKGMNSFDWRSLEDFGLRTVLENKDRLELEWIGLNSDEELKQAEEFLESQETAYQQETKAVYDDDDDDEEDEYIASDDKEKNDEEEAEPDKEKPGEEEADKEIPEEEVPDEEEPIEEIPEEEIPEEEIAEKE